ncbi:HupE/UreJ family protein [uncultured Thiohalocapsa sp.]|uniref:HupE/UreJ family protein n=1 Tax=uncultured Thiohalocapsa sp. TaxID=768990 RepID=UPI0025FA8B47|nr:HupE/UreJ family protein [uncultured Thiohalocapsa sp.]
MTKPRGMLTMADVVVLLTPARLFAEASYPGSGCEPTAADHIGAKECSGRVAPALLSAAMLLAPLPALAHLEAGASGGFLSGLNHPVSGLDHVLAMVAVGIWGAQLGRPAIWLLPVVFPLLMAFGGFAGLAGWQLPAIEVGIALSATVLGALILGQVRLPLAVAIPIVACFAVFHGHAHGTEMADGDSALRYSIGFVIATGLLHAAGIALGLIHHRETGRVLLRAAGSMVLAGGLYFLWGALA